MPCVAQVDLHGVNFATQVLLDALISTAIAVVVSGLGWVLGGQSRRSTLATVLLVMPLLTPPLLISYASAPLALPLVGSHWLLVFHAVLLGLKLAPLAILAHDLFPLPFSTEAIYCARLLPAPRAIDRVRFFFHQLGPTPWTVFGLIFLLAFTDFELASLLSLKRWTVMLFDAHAGGLAPGESLRRMALPGGIELGLLGLLAWLFTRHCGLPPGTGGNQTRPLWPVVILALLVTGLPVGRIFWLALPGFLSLGRQPVLLGDLLTSLGLAIAAAGTAWLLARLPRQPWAKVLWSLPGLLGGLVLSLAFVALLQLPLAHFGPEIGWGSVRLIRDSPLPLIFAEALLLVPIALFLRSLLAAQRSPEGLHLARMAGSRRLLWDLAVQPRAAALALLFILAFSELTAATILAPIGFTPAFARLHNLAHYGQTAVLSAMLLAAVAAPGVLLALTLGGARLYARRDAR